MTALLYGLTVLIWGTTWIAIKYQLGTVAIEASVVYRFAIAGTVLMVGLVLTRRLQRIGLRDQPFIYLQGLCLFCFNFLCFYTATQYMVTGVAAVIFSTATIMNVFNGFLFHRRTPEWSTVAGSAFGILGVIGLFWDSLAGSRMEGEALFGLGMALLGTYFFSVGNMVSARNQKRGITILSANAYGMFYGCGTLTLIALAGGVAFTFDPSAAYVTSLLYLAIPGSVVTFATYLAVVGRLGPEKAGYMTVLFPVMALGISTVWEGYQWTTEAAFGLVAILIGNVLVLHKGRLLPRRAAKPA